MGIEIERKFLINGDDWRSLAKGTVYRQGYLSTAKERTVRIRTIADKGFLTIKGISKGITRAEYEYEIPVQEAEKMLDDHCLKPLIEKKRYKIQFDQMTWEIDEFFGENKGLILAEVELSREDQVIKIPDWIGSEVTGNQRYYNASLIHKPFSKW